ncbi:DMT family transporter, partial [Cysteiniphilum halobium]|uniref:DMT family transporter n=1 Tax=Cysteiniphilum halobium TaxID=2219059 RepID=UPI0013C353F0
PLSLWEWYHRLTIVWQWQTVGSIFYAGVFASILAFSFWNIGVRTVGRAIAAYFFNLLPVFSSLLAIGFLWEKIHTYHVIGFLLVLSGILLATLPVYNLKQKLFSYVRRKMYA